MEGYLTLEEYLDSMMYEMQLCGMSIVTQENYRGHVKRFLTFCNKPVESIGEDEVRRYLHHLRYEMQRSVGTVNYYHTCIKFFFETTLNTAWNGRRTPRLRGYHTVPVILSPVEVQRILDCCESLKQRAILSTIYSAGLRNGEACRLRVQDILSETMQVFIRESKGNRDRYTILAESNLELLRQYWKECGKPSNWLFPSDQTESHISDKTVRRYFQQACLRAGINKKVTVHTLRHCFATHFLESGHTIYELRPLLGHSTIVSTARYVQLARPDKRNLQSPMDSWSKQHDC